MSKKIELPSDTKCFLCDSYYGIHQTFIVYKCFICMNYTPYCMPCEFKLQRLFGKGNFFKCINCDKLTYASDKIEISPSNNSNNININMNPINPFLKTPSKPFMENNVPISSIRHINNTNFLTKMKKNEEDSKDNNGDYATNKKMLMNFLNDFNQININIPLTKNSPNDINLSPFNNKNYINNANTVNNNRNINVSDISKDPNKTLTNTSSISNFQKINDFSLLTSRNCRNRRFCLNESLLERKRDDSTNINEFREYNRYNERKNSRIKDASLSRGKFKNLISMKMSKVYQNVNNNGEREKSVNEYRNKNCDTRNVFLANNNNSIQNGNGDNNSFSIFCFRGKNNDNNKNSLFGTNQSKNNFSFIDGKSTPHRLSNNNSFEYF